MKKFLMSLLCVMMVVCFIPTMAFATEAEEANPTGYNTSGQGNETLPAAPATEGDTIKVTPENAQYTLDGAYGNISGKTIVFSSGTYERLYFARPTKYAGSETVYRHGSFNNDSMSYADFIAYKSQAGWTEYCYYERNISNVTFTAEEGAVLKGISFETGAHIYGDKGSPIYDYVRDTGEWCDNTTNGYYHKVKITDITFDGIKFSFDGDFTLSIATSQPGTLIDGITVKNCEFKGTGTEQANKHAIRFYTEDSAADMQGNVGNLTVIDTKIDNYYQGIYTGNAHDITVTGNEITNTGHNAVAIQSKAYNSHGNVNITDNTFVNNQDRVIRMGFIGANSNFVIKNNTATNSGDEAGELVKDGGCHSGVTFEIAGNTLNGNAWSSDKIILNTVAANGLVLKSIGNKLIAVSENVACCIGNTTYNSLSEAIKNASDGNVVVLLKDNESLPEGGIVPDGVVLDFNGYALSSGSVVTEGTFINPPANYNFSEADCDVYKFADNSYKVIQKGSGAPAHSSGKNTWTWSAEKGYYEESYVAPHIPSGPSTPTDNVTNQPATQGTGTTEPTAPTTTANMSSSTTVKTETKVDAATGETKNVVTSQTTVDNATAEKIVDKAIANKSEEVVIDTTTSTPANTDAAQVGIPTATLEAISEKTEADVTVKTDVAEVTMDNKTAGEIAEQATGTTVQIIAEKTKEKANMVEFELKVVDSNGKVISDFNGGNVSVTVKVPAGMKDKKVVCVYIDDNGKVSKVKGRTNENGTYTFVTGHFSTYAIMTEEEADAAIEAQVEELVKGLADIDLVARSVRTSKGNVKVTLKVDKEGQALIDEIKEAGYTVKYNFYRSTKKRAGYVSKMLKGTTSYTNTYGKKGTLYYYKARVQVYDAEGKLIAETALKDCKYASRLWKK